jgi:hypothetical protein
MVKISRRMRTIRRSRRGRRSLFGGRPGSSLDCRTSDECNQAKFIEIENDDIINGVSDGTMNMNPNYNDKNYLRLINQYNAVNREIRVGDIIYIVGGERQYSCYIALRGNVQWLCDDGDTPDFILNLLKYKPILDKNNVKYNKLFRNEDYYVLRDRLEHISRPNQTISEYLLGSAVETTMPQEILTRLAEGGIRV